MGFYWSTHFMYKPYLEEKHCSWWCGQEVDVYMYRLDLSIRLKVTARLRPYCAACAGFLIQDGSEYHKPFKHDVLLAAVTKAILNETL